LPSIYYRQIAAKPVMSENDITALLVAWKEGDDEALKRLISVVYPEMRKIARFHLARRSASQTFESAALANEAYLKLIRAKGIEIKDRSHFLAVCAQIIRRVLVDHARNRRRVKRGGGGLHVTLDETLLAPQISGVDVLALEEALTSLGRIDERKCRVVELRFFGGLSVTESAEVLQVSVETVMRDWKMAKAWLYHELTSDRTRSEDV
jgi:RNA polymerase sigma-70 factor, ECF subfamily